MEIGSNLNYSELDEDNDDAKKKTHKCSIICPSLEYLSKAKINTNVICTVPNCGEFFSQESALRLHLKKVHRLDTQVSYLNAIKLCSFFPNKFKHFKEKIDDLIVTKARSRLQKLNENCDCKYYCPVEKCKFNLISTTSSTKFLPTFHSLKNHFIRMHGNKEFKCANCSKKFSIKSEMERHESKYCFFKVY